MEALARCIMGHGKAIKGYPCSSLTSGLANGRTDAPGRKEGDTTHHKDSIVGRQTSYVLVHETGEAPLSRPADQPTAAEWR
uniref:Uncharacterized protein n=1 Tax=Oryza meridionalis TaxID=40149 RepID=A0A0E0DI94_9ORYZ